MPLTQVEYNAESSCRASYPRESARVEYCLDGIQKAKIVFNETLDRNSTHYDLMQATYRAERTCPRDENVVDCEFGVRLLKEHLERRYL